MFQVEVIWVVIEVRAATNSLHPEDGGSMDLWNDGSLPQHYTASQPRRPRPDSCTLLLDPNITIHILNSGITASSERHLLK